MHLPKDDFAPDNLFPIKQSVIICNRGVFMRSSSLIQDGMDVSWLKVLL